MNNFLLGLSSNCLETDRPLDGIGVYTQKLMQHLPFDLELWAYPNFLQKSPTSRYTQGHFWSHSFAVNTLLSAWQGKRETPLQLFHATDYRIPRLTCPVLATLYDAVPLQYPAWVTSRGRRLKSAVMRHTAQWADGIIAISQAVVADVVQHFALGDKKIHVIPLGIDPVWLTTLAENILIAVKQRYQLPAHYYLFVGTLQPRKNVLRLLQAFQLLPAAIRQTKKLVIVGQAGWRNESVLPLLNRLIAQHEVIWLTDIQDELTLRAIYQQAGVFVFPSLYEGFGIPVLEAFASGIPVITSNTSALPEVAGEAAWLVDPTNVEELSHAMATLADDADLCTHYQIAGFARAQQRTWATCAAETLAVYRQYL